ncbi:MAG: molybdopterin-dependent oxidoreductase [Chloroflexota bacterium]
MSELALQKPKADEVTLTIDGKLVEVKRGTSVLNAARKAGVYIPHLCDHPSIKPYAGCRLCLVEIEGRRGLDTSCTVPVAEGMVVRTDTPQIRQMQRDVLEIMLSDHPDRCLNCSRLDRCPPFGVCQRDDIVTDRCVVCPGNRQCELQRVVDFLGLRRQRFYFVGRRSSPPEHSNPFIERNPDCCIFCTRCVRVCDEVRGIGALGPANRGPHDQIIVDFDTPLPETNCEFCGQCALVCPTGAIVKLDSRHGRISDNSVLSTCGYCAVGCGLYLNLKEGQLVNVTPQPDSPVSNGCLCVKGHFGYDYVTSEKRLRRPLLRESDGQQRVVSWQEALDVVASRLLEIREKHGPDAIGFIASPKCTNEDNYLLQKLARTVIGTNNIDQSARFRYAPTIKALQAAFGAVGATGAIADVDKAGCLLVLGTNVTETHTVLGLQIKRAVRQGAKLILVDPRETPLARFAELWLRPRPGTDGVLINGLLRVIVEEGLADEGYLGERCEGLGELQASLARYTLSYVSAATGVAEDRIALAARLFAKGGDVPTGKPLANQASMAWACSTPATRSSSIFYGAGVAQQPDAEQIIAGLANLAMVTGNLGKVGGGLFPLSGQNNTLGACDVGALAEYLPGYRRVDDAGARAEVEGLWGCDVPSKPGMTLLEMLEGARNGQIKALYVMGNNLLLSTPDSAWVEECLRKAEFVVVQDVFASETSKLAHVVLPGATFAEKEGTFTNLERRVQRIRRALEPIGEAKADWQILCELGDKMLSKRGKPTEGNGFGYVHPSHVMEEISKVVPAYGGISYQRLGDRGLQWPCPDPSHPGTATMFQESFPRGKGRLAAATERKPVAAISAKYPLLLITGSTLYHHDSGTTSRESSALLAMRPEAYLEINPADAARARLSDGDLARVTSQAGSVEVKVKTTRAVSEGVVFLPIHYSDAPAMRLIPRPKDDLRQMPAFKRCPVSVERISRLVTRGGA